MRSNYDQYHNNHPDQKRKNSYRAVPGEVVSAGGAAGLRGGLLLGRRHAGDCAAAGCDRGRARLAGALRQAVQLGAGQLADRERVDFASGRGRVSLHRDHRGGAEVAYAREFTV